ncbi:hypothetical protein [Marinobacter sp.]|uniref:hypothetical protein n=1 Tax=Marinobacter sp. TaxID=50741 RepID=UPI00384B39BD
MRCSILTGILFFSAQAHCDMPASADVSQIANTANFITRTSLCHTLASELTRETEDHFPELTEGAIRSLTNAGWNSEDLAQALTLSQDSLKEVSTYPQETRSDYLQRLYESEFGCHNLDHSGLDEIAASIPEKSAEMK